MWGSTNQGHIFPYTVEKCSWHKHYLSLFLIFISTQRSIRGVKIEQIGDSSLEPENICNSFTPQALRWHNQVHLGCLFLVWLKNAFKYFFFPSPSLSKQFFILGCHIRKQVSCSLFLLFFFKFVYVRACPPGTLQF